MLSNKKLKIEKEERQLIADTKKEFVKQTIAFMTQCNAELGNCFSYFIKPLAGGITDCIKLSNNKYYAIDSTPIFKKIINRDLTSALTIHLAQDIDTNQWVQLKAYEINNDKQLEDKIKKEISVLSQLGKLIGVADDSLFSRKLYIVKEYVPGVDLMHFITNKKAISFAQKIAITLAIFDELRELHDIKRFLHCDIKLENIIYDEFTGKVTLIDFDVSLPSASDSNLMAKSNEFCGTFGYAAPELISNTPCIYNEKTEMYALGKTLIDLFDLEPASGFSQTFFAPNKPPVNEDESQVMAILDGLTQAEPEKRLSREAGEKAFALLLQQVPEFAVK